MPVKLARLEIRNFRSIYGSPAAVFDLANGMNAIVGPNNSGKSNVLRALALAFDDSPEAFSKLADAPVQLAWARPSVTLEFRITSASVPEKTLLRYAREYERPIVRPGVTSYADRGIVRLRVKYQGEARQEFIAVAGAGDRRGDDRANDKTLKQLKKCIRFVLVRSGEDLNAFLAGRFTDVLHSVLQERASDLLIEATEQRDEYVSGLQTRLLEALTERITDEISEVIPEISAVELTPYVPTLAETIQNADVMLADAAATSLEEKGTGVRGSLLVAMLRYIADQSRRSLVIGVEEPESFLHPAAQEMIRDDLEGLAERPDLTLLVSTHSPYILSRDPDAALFAIGKSNEGATAISGKVVGDAAHAPALSGLFRTSVVPDLLDVVAQVAPGAVGVLVTEGYTDMKYLEFAASVSGRRDLLRSVLIRSGGGAGPAAIEALVWKARGIETAVLLDDDSSGRKERDLLKGRFGFDEDRVFTTDIWLPGETKETEIEDLFAPSFMQRFLDDHDEDEVLAEKTKTTTGWHHGLTPRGKYLFSEYLAAEAEPEDVERLVEILEDVVDVLAAG